MAQHFKPSVVALLIAAFAAACSDGGMPTSPTAGGLNAAKVKITALTAADVVVPGGDGGAFVNTFLANNSGRANTEFWDNLSADIIPTANETCNIGFYAAGAVVPGCLHEQGNGNQGGYAAGKYWGDGPADRDASSFVFEGAYSYTVKLLGTYHGSPSEVGYFTKSGSTYTFFSIGNDPPVGTQQTINTGGADWGFYIKNDFNRQGSGCNGDLLYHCSDAEGGFAGVPYQQFALFVNSGETKYLVGFEDNWLGLLPADSPRDSDYNDYIFEVVPTAPELTLGRMTGGGILTYGGQAISLGLTLHCDITLSNNLEINWPGNKWHLDKPITLALCSDDPNISQKPPVAPLDTFVGEGFGMLNGVVGSKVEFALVDWGEPGSDDQVRLKIYAPNSSTVVLDVPLTVLNKGGNIQAHYDQPHGDKP